MENRTRLESIIARSNKKKQAKAEANGEGEKKTSKKENTLTVTGSKETPADQTVACDAEDHDHDHDHDHHHAHLEDIAEDAEARQWGELRDVCGPGRGVVQWVLTPFIGTLPSAVPLLKKKEL